MNKHLQKRDLIEIYKNNGFSFEEATAEIDLAIEIMCGISPKDMIIGIMPDPKDINRLKSIVEHRVKTRQPLVQILGYTYFMGQKFQVSSNTLIPRPETELLVKTAVKIIKEKDFKQILDIGTGTDISNEALKIALNNAMHLDLMNKAIFRKSDLFSKIREEEKFDMIVSNPPYIPLGEKENLQPELDYEPSIALFTKDKDGIEYYEKITKQTKYYLKSKGCLVFEIGINQACLVENILKENNFRDINILNDVSGIQRIIYGFLE